MQSARFAEILRLLATNDVEFIVVGMTAGVLHGAPVTTIDLHIVHRRSSEDVARLLRVLGELDAFYRHDPRRLRPRDSHLGGSGHQLLTTIYGDLDCLGAIDDGRGRGLLDRTTTITLAGGSVVRVGLPALIEIKQRSGRPKTSRASGASGDVDEIGTILSRRQEVRRRR
jgi:hypothetical protein